MSAGCSASWTQPTTAGSPSPSCCASAAWSRDLRRRASKDAGSPSSRQIDPLPSQGQDIGRRREAIPQRLQNTRRSAMGTLSRKRTGAFTRRAVVKGGIGAARALAMPALLRVTARTAFAADARATIKVAPETDLKIFDPIWTTATITSTHSWAVYDTLFTVDSKYNV